MRRQLDYLRVLGASKESAKELKLFGLGDFITDEYARLANDLYDQNVALARRQVVGGRLSVSVKHGGLLRRLRIRCLSDGIGRSQLGNAAVPGRRHRRSEQQYSNHFLDILEYCRSISVSYRFGRILPSPADGRAPSPTRSLRRDRFAMASCFENVSFSYPGSPRRVLDHLNLRIEPGERIALIGENGQGKTTIVKLITRLYDPTGGRILLDGVDLRDYSIEDLNREIGVIFQDFMRYEMTARSNIAVGRIDNESQADIQQAAHKSLADAVIRRLPNGYEQLLGRRFEGGLDLSGGEWQKVALARAYLRDAQLLILDEPTAALDARSEYEVFQRFAELTHGKMALLISHRFSTVRMADRIVVLENGNIAEQGSHTQLMALSARYAEMFELQAASYR